MKIDIIRTKKLLAIILIFPMAAFAVTVEPLPPSEYADTEVTTNMAFAVERPAMTRIEFTVALHATPTNNVEVAIGADANGDGNLSVEESAYAFGYDCGTWFCRARDENKIESSAVNLNLQPQPRLSHTFILKGAKDAVGTAEGGWGFNMLAYDPPLVYSALQAGLMVADGTITSTPVFNCEFVPMLSDTADLDGQMYALAKCVPALSSPMGGVQVVSDVVSENFNLNDLNRPNGWGRINTYWLHSDMKDMAYFYVFQLYEELVDKGGLR